MSEHANSGLPDSCPNCTEPALGRFCAGCGQSLVLEVPSLWRFFQEYVQNFVAAEGKLWQTLRALVLKPGRITADYLEGRRARYVKPLALYLSCSFLFFTVFLTLTPVVKEGARAAVTEFARTLAGQDEEGRPRRGYDTPEQEQKYREVRRWADEVAHQPGVLLQQVSLSIFLSVPLLAFWFKLAYRRRRLNYGAHLLHALHYLSFSFLATMVLFPVVLLPTVSLDGRILDLGDWALLGVSLYQTAYLILASRRVYGGRCWPQVLRVLFILSFHTLLWLMALVVWVLFSSGRLAA